MANHQLKLRRLAATASHRTIHNTSNSADSRSERPDRPKDSSQVCQEAFNAADPAAWNSLSTDIRTISSTHKKVAAGRYLL